MTLTHWFGTWNPHKVSFSKLGYFPEDVCCAVNKATRTRATSIPKVPSRFILRPHTALHLHFPDSGSVLLQDVNGCANNRVILIQITLGNVFTVGIIRAFSILLRITKKDLVDAFD